jgi:hypothetical protein
VIQSKEVPSHQRASASSSEDTPFPFSFAVHACTCLSCVCQLLVPSPYFISTRRINLSIFICSSKLYHHRLNLGSSTNHVHTLLIYIDILIFLLPNVLIYTDSHFRYGYRFFIQSFDTDTDVSSSSLHSRYHRSSTLASDCMIVAVEIKPSTKISDHQV